MMNMPIEILAWADESIDAWIEMKKQSPESITTPELMQTFMEALDRRAGLDNTSREVLLLALTSTAMQRLVEHA